MSYQNLLSIHSLQKEDIPRLADLYFPWTTKEKTLEKWQAYLEEQKKGMRLAQIVKYQDKILGYGHLFFASAYLSFRNKNIPEIQDVWIFENERKKGMGTTLITHLENIAKQKGYLQIGIGVGLYRDYGQAQKLYSQLDYKPDGEGITYQTIPVVTGKSYPVDDELILWLVKLL